MDNKEKNKRKKSKTVIKDSKMEDGKTSANAEQNKTSTVKKEETNKDSVKEKVVVKNKISKEAADPKEAADKSEDSKKESDSKEAADKKENFKKESDSKETADKKEKAEKQSPKKEETEKTKDSEETKKEEVNKEESPEKESEQREAKIDDLEKKGNEKDSGKSEESKKSNDSKNEPESKKNDVNEKKVTNNAITQSKRLADAKAAMNSTSLVSDTKDNKKNNAAKKKKAIWVTLGSVAGILLVAYIAGFIYFSKHFYQDVTINGINVSGMNDENAKQLLDNFYQSYTLTIETIDGEQILIDGKDISMEIMLHDEFDSCLKQQNAYLWFVNLFKHYDFTVGADTTWSQSELAEILESMEILEEKNMVSPEDAYVGVEDGKFTIIKEVMGTTINKNKFEQTVENGLSNVMSVLVLKDEGCYSLPKVYSTDDSLQKDLEAKNAFAENEIKLQLDDLTLEPGMELYEAVLEKKTDSYEVSQKLVEKYVKTLAEEYDTLGTDRTFTTSFDEKEIQVNGTAFGYEINQEETVTALYNALTAGKAATVEVVFNQKGYTLIGENDIGDTYIEVNLSEQKVFGYKDGKKIAEGDCVSGNESAGNGTCVGLYAIQNKLSPTVLRGEKKPVTKTTTKKKNGKKVKVTTTTYEYEYESPVTFWMQFNGGIGLHDAAGWRSVYGGSIYYYSGSHGCVNLPYDLAETLYNNFDIGTPVIVYFWDNENRR